MGVQASGLMVLVLRPSQGTWPGLTGISGVLARMRVGRYIRGCGWGATPARSDASLACSVCGAVLRPLADRHHKMMEYGLPEATMSEVVLDYRASSVGLPLPSGVTPR